MPGYLLCRPRGGFNDQLVQAELCWRYALRHDRALILDTTRSGLQEDFFRYFETLPGQGLQPHAPRDPELPDLATFDSVRPSCLAGRVASYTPVWDASSATYRDDASGALLSFDRRAPHAETLLVHEQCGSGRDGLRLLGRVRFTPDLADTLVERLRPLPRRYRAAHVRNTDVEARFEPFVNKLRRKVWGGHLVVCSDDHQSIEAIRAALRRQTRVRTASNVPDLEGGALHVVGADVDRRATNLDLFTDLLALAGARRLYLCRTADGMGRGYGKLARALGRHPRRVRSLLSAAADQDFVQWRFARPAR